MVDIRLACRIPLRMGTSAIVWYPFRLEEVNFSEIWSENRSHTAAERELALYIHIPFCTFTCDFCVLSMYPYTDDSQKLYLRALQKEMDLYSAFLSVNKSRIVAVYFGGGTPTSLSTDSLVDLLDYVQDKFSLDENAEITMEAHPLTINEHKLKIIREKGVNRISIGVQSFRNSLLNILGCPHNAIEGVNAIKVAKNSGFDNVGIDLLYKVPSQDMQIWRNDLESAVEYGLDHISCYSLVIGCNTALYRRMEEGKIPSQPDEITGFNMLKFAKTYLEENSYEQYTVSNFAKTDKKCRYIRIALEPPQGEFLGLGVGAKEYVNDFFSQKTTSLQDYFGKVESGIIPYKAGIHLSKEEQMARYMVIGIGCLRVSKRKFKELFSFDLGDVYGDIVEKLEKWGLIEENSSHISVTEKGMGYITSISQMFFTKGTGGVAQGEIVL